MLAQGLMYRERLDQQSGMLFKFPNLTYASFWGKNTYIPLDIAFICDDGTICDINQITPMSTRSIYSARPCKYALEVNAGFLKENQIDIGTKVEIDEKNKMIKLEN